MRKLIVGIILSGAVLTGCSITSEPTSLTFKRDKLDAVIAASRFAAQCGGYLVIDTDDKEALVGGCDR